VSTGQATLDDVGLLRRADPSGMLAMIERLGEDLRRGYGAGVATPGIPPSQAVSTIVCTGMGGSGVAGDVLRSGLSARLRVPVVVSKAATLPAFCDGETLVVALSYSGNTEETIEALDGALAAGCRIVVVTSGGSLGQRADESGVPRVSLPVGLPAPRAAMGYLAGATLGVVEAAGAIDPLGPEIEQTASDIELLATRLGPEAPVAENQAKDLAGWLGARIPVVWGTEGIAEAAALRWKSQFNENAKTPSFSSTLPELDHNEIEGWSAGAGEPFGVIVLRHPGEHGRIGARVDATREAVAGSRIGVRDAGVEAGTPLGALFSLILLGDFTSAYLAIARGVDPMPVPVLSGLKERLRR
jgi:glucose/mannose-6-phosphate isomerase